MAIINLLNRLMTGDLNSLEPTGRAVRNRFIAMTIFGVIAMFLVTVAWEYFLEGPIFTFFGWPYDAAAELDERWNFIIKGTVTATIPLVILGAALYRQYQRLASHLRKSTELSETVSKRTAQLRKTEALLKENHALQEQLVQSTKMEAIGRLTGGMAHELNNHLAVIFGSLDMMAAHKNLDKNLTRHIEAGIAGTHQASQLTQSLLAFARKQPLQPRPTEINAPLARVIGRLRRTLGEDIAVGMALAPDTGEVLIDVPQLESCIVNLANNARDAMPNGGHLTISTRNGALGRDAAPPDSGAPPEKFVIIEMHDTGIGMPADVLNQAFEPLFTTKGAGHGSGLGLSMVHGFVKQSGGHITLQSESGRGTTVTIYLPKLFPHERAVTMAPSPTPRIARGSESILVVEDNVAVRQVVIEQLSSLGYATQEATTAVEALTVLEQQRNRVDLLFTDIVMPGSLNGSALAERAQVLRPGLRVLLTSGFAAQADTARRQFRLLSKPYRRAELAGAVRSVLDAR